MRNYLQRFGVCEIKNKISRSQKKEWNNEKYTKKNITNQQKINYSYSRSSRWIFFWQKKNNNRNIMNCACVRWYDPNFYTVHSEKNKTNDCMVFVVVVPSSCKYFLRLNNFNQKWIEFIRIKNIWPE